MYLCMKRTFAGKKINKQRFLLFIVRTQLFPFPGVLSPPQKVTTKSTLVDVEHGLELDDELPLVQRDVFAVELLETVDASPRDLAVQSVWLLQLPAVRRLVAAHLDLDGHRGLTLLADRDLLVLSLDGRPNINN